MRKTNSLIVAYLGKTICPKCHNHGYAYIKQNFDNSRFVKINHYVGWNNVKHRNIMTYCYCDICELDEKAQFRYGNIIEEFLDNGMRVRI